MDIINQLREQAEEIAHEGHNGWGNTMLVAADIIEKFRSLGFRVCPNCLSIYNDLSCKCGYGIDGPKPN